MTDGFLNIDSTRLTGHANLLGGHYFNSPDSMTTSQLRALIGWLPVAVALAAATWLVLAEYARKQAASEPIHLALATTPEAVPVTVGLAKVPAFNPLISEAIAPEQPAPVDGLKISSQSWRRGGLGSNAFVTMTLRNSNEYAVKDIEISCAFARQDGSHLTDRTRVIHDAINLKSRKTLARLHVGFVNVNAAKAKCSLVAASHI